MSHYTAEELIKKFIEGYCKKYKRVKCPIRLGAIYDSIFLRYPECPVLQIVSKEDLETKMEEYFVFKR